MAGKILKIATFTLSLSMSAAVACADMITPNGSVIINRGNGFQPIDGPTQVGPNDVVVVNNGSAEFVNDAGQTVTLTPGQMYTVGMISPPPPPPMGGGLAGGVGGGLTTGTLVIGGVIVAGGIAGIVASQNKSKSDNKPVSASP